jgi:(R,R)-butanediol dehydrogenase/meso-butanediol dehydrogenase/diacetyl reductase
MMRALQLSGPEQLEVADVAAPGEPGPGEVLIAPRMVGICGTDLQLWRHGPVLDAPQILGHEVAATILDVGPDVAGLKPGDRVAVIPIVACGRCEMCRRGRGELCPGHESFGIMHPWGGFAERAIARADQLVPIPDELSFEQGALVEPLGVASTGIERASVGAGDRLLIVGGGPIGALAALHAEAIGLAQILVSEPLPARAALIEKLGFEVVDPNAVNVAELCRERTGGLGFDAAVDYAGSQAAFDTALAAVRPAGSVAVTALYGSPVQLDARLMMSRGLTVAGAIAFPLWSWPRRMEQIATGGLGVDRIVTSRIGLGEADDAVRRLADRLADDLKVMVDIGGT